MSGQGVCRLHKSPQGCRYGTKCKFTHDVSADSRASSPGASARSVLNSPRSPRSPSTLNSSGLGGGNHAPRGVCDFYWQTGQCNRGFDCTFRHSQMPATMATLTANTASGDVADEEAANAALDFFTAEGLVEVAGVARHENHSLKPEDAHNEIKKFLRDDYTFRSPSDMQGFVRILASINKRNKAWDSDSAQEFLDMIVRGNALERIGDVLKFSQVSSNAGTGITILSFQLGYFPILEYLTSDLVLKTTLHHNINAIYTVIYNNYQHVHDTVMKCCRHMIAINSWKDQTPGLPSSRQGLLNGVTVFKTITTLILQFFSRFKRAIRDHPEVVHLVNDVVAWFNAWSENVSCDPPRFDDPVTSDYATRKLLIVQLREDVMRLQSIVTREHKATENLRKPAKKQTISHADKQEALLTRLIQSYDPPGDLRKDGKRHDNDFANISDIRIAPTNNELMCPIPPYLPVNISEAPHHRAPNSMERHLDIQFRLLREDLTFPIRESLAVVSNDLGIMWQPIRNGKRQLTMLEQLLVKDGGLYRTTGKNSVIFNVYTNVTFAPLKAERNGFTVGLLLSSPPGGARDPSFQKREEYWKHAGSKKLTSGSLVALVLVNKGQSTVYLGTLVSSNQEIAESAKAFQEQIIVRAEFFDAEIELRALRNERISVDQSTFAILIDNNVMFESVRPFLKTLNSIEPTTIPFSRYICQNSNLKGVAVLPPKYATTPSFAFKLDCLVGPRDYTHPLRVSDPNSIVRARLQLKTHSYLDPSQCDSVVDALTREVCLIQGPPGTGKSFTGKELLRVLLANKIKPIVLIAYTNHALDHMLIDILDAKITKKLVRLGSRSSDERISEYSLAKLEKLANTSSLDRSVGREYGKKKKLEEQMKLVMESIQIPDFTWETVEDYLMIHYPDHLSLLTEPPFWISELARQTWEAEDAEGSGEWTKVEEKGKKRAPDHLLARTFYGFWKHGLDIHFIQPPQFPEPPTTDASRNRSRRGKKIQTVVSSLTQEVIQNAILEYQQKVANFFFSLGFINQVPPLPVNKRPTTELLSKCAVWSMSLDERARLATYWEDEMRGIAYNSHVSEYESLRIEYQEACTRFNDVKDESRRRLLSQTDLIGCTTTGAAKLISLLTNIAPRILMVEEAGQVLEAHVMASLVPSVQHLICIGDPQQLRPTLATFSLSMDNERGLELFKFDRSLMERLADNGMPMSLINVQRRMRPDISHFIRTILYPNLEDHSLVHDYPHVQGMEKDVFFFTHTNKEDGGDESVSKVNSFEVKMIVDLVMYFLKQEEYNSAGAIAVLCAYLGQLQQVRAALRSLKISVSVDERDEEQLVKQGLDENGFEEVSVAKHIRLGTVDIFQGEEAKIVIVSLVRNSGTFDTEGSIGFLKSVNRINVALSRAKHGLYILGNASNLRKNPTWTTIVEEMEKRDQIGFGFPVICPRHPGQRKIINKPGQLAAHAPEGGCLLLCNFRLDCGHNCTSSCHADRDNHKSMKCHKPCIKISCVRLHPCPKPCWEDCGKCEHPIPNVTLPCGHRAKSVFCHELEDLKSVKCTQKVHKKLPFCEHSAAMPCHQDPSNFTCQTICDGQMDCCSKKCKSRCTDCQKLNLDVAKKRTGVIKRSNHKDHPCERPLYCQHNCGSPCSKDHECSTECRQTCRQRCDHHKCPKPCSASCSPCMEACPWRCPHGSCPVLCGSICSRLPCDEKCSHELKCGHPCPSVCGEPCSKQKCVLCLPPQKKTDIVDFIMQRPLSDIDLTSDDIGERLITLECGHVFTVETLDGHCGMAEYYVVDPMTGMCTATKAPPINYQSPPTCPTCRGPITALRYGRITKRANLDILEQNVASNMSKALESCNPELVTISAELSDFEEAAKKLKYEPDFKPPSAFDDLVTRRSEKFGKPDEPLGANILDQNSMKAVHGLDERECRAWFKIVKGLVNLYKKVVDIAKTRSAHAQAYEAALSTLYRLELVEIAEDPTRITDHPEANAIEAVNRKIGQPPHKADRRYHVEAFLLSIELRFMLTQVARARVDSLPVTSNDEMVLHHRQLWFSYVDFIFDSCILDCKKTISIADSTSAYRQTARAAVMQMRAEFEKFRFGVVDRRAQLFKSGELVGKQKLLLAEIAKKKAAAEVFFEKVSKSYIRSRPAKDSMEMKAERVWLVENCGKKAQRVFQEYDELQKYITVGGLYQPMTLQEREDIVKAFGFTHRGHFYNCENGHTFVITECGGAMENAKCPECGASIGGSGHRLNSSNTRAMEFEEIAGRQGAEGSPWEWARGA